MSSKKLVLLSSFLTFVALSISLLAYVNISHTKAQSLSDEQADCLQRKSLELTAQHQQTGPRFPAVYLLSPESEQVLPPRVLEAHGIQVVTTPAQLILHVTQNANLAALYLHSLETDGIDRAWLKQLYESGVAIVGLNTLASELARKLDVEPQLEDLRLEYRRGRPFIAVFHNSRVDKRTSNSVYADFVADPSRIPTIVAQVIDPYDLSEEYANALRQECLS